MFHSCEDERGGEDKKRAHSSERRKGRRGELYLLDSWGQAGEPEELEDIVSEGSTFGKGKPFFKKGNRRHCKPLPNVSKAERRGGKGHGFPTTTNLKRYISVSR